MECRALIARRAFLYKAVALFVDRVRGADANFVLTDDNASAVADIVMRLDGIPLAIEVAAARTGSVGIADVRRRLDERFIGLDRMGSSGISDSPTLRATMDWSYDLLSGRERRVFELLAVFAGGWTLEAAEAEIATLVASLVDRSLVMADTSRADNAAPRRVQRSHSAARDAVDLAEALGPFS